jgi:K+-sensing histidine kinase KdpD
VQVIDNGPGIPDDIRERMFYPLVSGREGGSGLGLTMAQSFRSASSGHDRLRKPAGSYLFHDPPADRAEAGFGLAFAYPLAILTMR